MNKISSFFKSLFSETEEEENAGFISVVTPELKTKELLENKLNNLDAG